MVAEWYDQGKEKWGPEFSVSVGLILSKEHDVIVMLQVLMLGGVKLEGTLLLERILS